MLAHQFLVTRVGAAGIGKVGFGLVDQRTGSCSFGIVLTRILLCGCKIGLSTLQGDGERLRIDIEQRIAFVYVLVIPDVDRDHAPVDLRRDIHHVRVDIGIFRTA